MANAWNGMTFTNIARKGISTFIKKLIPVRAFTTDFSADLAQQGDTVNTRIVPASSAAQSLSGVHSGQRSLAAEDTTTTTKAVTLNQDPIVGFHLTDEEAMLIGSGVWEDTKNRIIEQKINALGNSVLNYIFNLITAANFSNIVHTGLASAFDMDDVVDIGTTLTDADWPMGEMPVSMVLKSSYYDGLKKDNAIQDLSASGLAVIKEGDRAIRQLDDFTLIKSPTLPPAGGTPAGENLTGFVARPECISIAMRAVKAQEPARLMFFQILTDDQTGITMVMRAWYDPDFGKVYVTFETLFGAAPAYATALQRIRSSA